MQNKQVGNAQAVEVLAQLVERVTYKPGWKFELQEVNRGQGCAGLTLMISATLDDSSNPGAKVGVLHLMPVLPAAYDEDAWMGWILEQIMLVEQHEALEFYKVDGEAPFFPGHAPGRNPYGVARVIASTPKDHDTAYAPATPWYGGTPTDPHFQA
jgi:hypothetical protein